MDFIRQIDLATPLKRKSQFLFGPRLVGKSYWIRHSFAADEVAVFDLLDSDIYNRLLRRPRQLGEEISGVNRLVVIDEIQKIPLLLNEVHRLIEERRIRFLLTGSSARKLRQRGTNLLAGRAGLMEMFPLVSCEISGFDLLKYLQRGGIPQIYSSESAETELKDYVSLYLKEEIMAESLVRRIDHFSRFMDVMGLQSGCELNYQEISSDAGVPPRTLANFIDVLKDTLLAFEVVPFLKSKKRKAIQRSKVYLFDVGVANYMAGRVITGPKTDAFGRAFEYFIIQELRAFISYHGRREELAYWRTTTEIEVDCVVGNKFAVEIKSKDQISERDLKGLRALREEGLIKRLMVVSQDPVKRVLDGIEVWPWEKFLSALWSGEFVR